MATQTKAELAREYHALVESGVWPGTAAKRVGVDNIAAMRGVYKRAHRRWPIPAPDHRDQLAEARQLI